MRISTCMFTLACTYITNISLQMVYNYLLVENMCIYLYIHIFIFVLISMFMSVFIVIIKCIFKLASVHARRCL